MGDKKGEGQAMVHLTGGRKWWTGRSVIEDDTPTLTQELTKEINKIVNE